jgi:nitrate reductase cytochrome c-type subunit
VIPNSRHRPGRAWLGGGTVLGSVLLTAWGCASQVAPADDPPAVSAPVADVAVADVPAADAPIADALGAVPLSGLVTAEAAGLVSRLRVATPLAWSRERVPWFVTVSGRLSELESAADRERSLRRRAERRAYDGAPPTLGHSAEFGVGTRSCLDCHLEGMSIGDRRARPMSHAPMSQCLQCHVESVQRTLGPADLVPNSFRGRAAGATGTTGGLSPRMPPEMPPEMPHGLLMRGRCLSCHGEHGYAGLQSSHPRRAQCVQCHVPAAGRDFLAPGFGRPEGSP